MRHSEENIKKEQGYFHKKALIWTNSIEKTAVIFKRSLKIRANHKIFGMIGRLTKQEAPQTAVHNVDGFLCNSDDITEFTDAITSLLKKNILYKEMN